MSSNKIYNLDDLIYLNHLWSKIFPYLAVFIKELYGKDYGQVLEYGTFSGGIALELAKLSSKFKISIGGLKRKDLIDYTQNWISTSHPSADVTINGSLADFADAKFDLVISRGFFFYLEDENILADIYKLLKPKGVAILGGGYGKLTPQIFIDEIAQESKSLNDKLGRKWLIKEDLVNIIKKSNLTPMSEIIDEGGLWIKICKNG